MIRKTIRKTVLGLAAVAALATTALVPTSASAGYGYGYGYGYKPYYKPHYGYTYYKPYCYTKKVWTSYGWRWIKVCR